MEALSFVFLRDDRQRVLRNAARVAEYTYICVGAHASQPSLSIQESLAIGHCIGQYREGRGNDELCLALFAGHPVNYVIQ